MQYTVEVRQLVKKYPGFQLGPLEILLADGLLYGLVGPNGAGKSTLINIISGLVRPDSGELFLLGEGPGVMESPTRARIGIVRDEPALAENIDVGRLICFAAQCYPRWQEAVMKEWLNRFNLDTRKKVKELSKGAKLKLNIAMALSHEADVLFLDEPFAGLDLVARKVLREALQDIRNKRKTSILLSSHDIDEIEKLCDSIVLLSRGKILRTGSPQDLAARWVKWEFSCDEAISPPDVLREHHRDNRRSTWILEQGEVDIADYLARNKAADIERRRPTLEEIFTILLSEDEAR